MWNAPLMSPAPDLPASSRPVRSQVRKSEFAFETRAMNTQHTRLAFAEHDELGGHEHDVEQRLAQLRVQVRQLAAKLRDILRGVRSKQKSAASCSYRRARTSVKH